MKGHAHLLDDEGRQRLVRHGFLPERDVMTGIGKVTVQVPRVRDRGGKRGWLEGPVQFFAGAAIFAQGPSLWKNFWPWLYLKGISTGDFQRGAGITCWTRRRWIVRLNNHTPKGDLVGTNMRPGAKRRPIRKALRLYLGRRCLLQPAPGR